MDEVFVATKLLALDVDGVLTDGRIVYSGRTETQAFHVHDGQAIKWAQSAGVTIAWITGRGCEATQRRAEELGVKELFMLSGPKDVVLTGIQERLGVSREETVAMGDDLPDLMLAREAGLFAAPANARKEVRAAAELVTSAEGGAGAVRELIELILRAKGTWRALTGER